MMACLYSIKNKVKSKEKRFMTDMKYREKVLFRICRAIEIFVVFHLGVAAIWSLCYVIGKIFESWGVA